MLRCIDDAARVAGLLSDAWSRERGLAAAPLPMPAAPEARTPSTTGVRHPGGLSTAR
jgi:hypothetical protein